MCIQTIKSVGVKEYASELWTSIKEIDGGKILSSASELLEVNTKAIKKKLESLCDENTAFAIRDKLYPVSYTHLDVYKRQHMYIASVSSARSFST